MKITCSEKYFTHQYLFIVYIEKILIKKLKLVLWEKKKTLDMSEHSENINNGNTHIHTNIQHDDSLLFIYTEKCTQTLRLTLKSLIAKQRTSPHELFFSIKQ